MAEGVRDINKLAVIKKEAPQLADQIQKLYAGILTTAQGGHPAFLTDAQIATLSAEMDTFQSDRSVYQADGKNGRERNGGRERNKEGDRKRNKTDRIRNSRNRKTRSEAAAGYKRERDKTAGTIHRDTGKSKTGKGKRTFHQSSFERKTASEMEKSQKRRRLCSLSCR